MFFSDKESLANSVDRITRLRFNCGMCLNRFQCLFLLDILLVHEVFLHHVDIFC